MKTKCQLIFKRFFICFVICCSCYSITNAQNEKITLSLTNVTLKEALKAIEAKSDYTFVYSDSKIDLNHKLSIDVNNEKISEVLNQLLTNCTYKTENNKIILLPQTETSPATEKKISGSVVDEDGQKITGAAIIVKGTNTGTITDLDGNFLVVMPAGTITIIVSYINYEKKEINTDNLQNIKVVLKKSH